MRSLKGTKYDLLYMFKTVSKIITVEHFSLKGLYQGLQIDTNKKFMVQSLAESLWIFYYLP